ncbi:hypothetical protein [Streptomyces sp. NPDC057582]|uniref:hypothetical protein n=1 Tax=Streptomyces sp. NPDC057582 TaxID=3346174 RepID=UPI0036A312A6
MPADRTRPTVLPAGEGDLRGEHPATGPPLSSPEDIDELEGWTLHRLRHSALTHDAERGTSTPMLLARSRHACVRSLERYARPGVDAVAAHVAASDPAARRRG